jgi:hypothetical protein
MEGGASSRQCRKSPALPACQPLVRPCPSAYWHWPAATSPAENPTLTVSLAIRQAEYIAQALDKRAAQAALTG